jgi:hypothetical protein
VVVTHEYVYHQPAVACHGVLNAQRSRPCAASK